MLSVTNDYSGVVTSFLYDAFGHRVEMSSGGTYQNSFVRIGGYQLSAKGQTPFYSEYPFPGGSMQSEDGGATGVQLGDWLGTSRAFWSYTGGGFGQSGAHAPFGESYALSSGYAEDFTGQQTFDGVTYAFQERYYHSTQGRWLSPDPAGGGAANVASPQSWNRYAYVMNNPLALVDSLGLDCASAGEQSVTINAGDCPGVDPNNEYYYNCDGCLMTATSAFLYQNGDLLIQGTVNGETTFFNGISDYDYTAPPISNPSSPQVGVPPLPWDTILFSEWHRRTENMDLVRR